MSLYVLNLTEVTLSVSVIILLLAGILRLVGGKFTALCRYILWLVVIGRLAIPVGAVFLPSLVEIPVLSSIEDKETDARETSAAEETVPPISAETAQPIFAETDVPRETERVSAPSAESGLPVPLFPDTDAVPAVPADTQRYPLPSLEAETEMPPEETVSVRKTDVYTLLFTVYAVGACVFLLWHLLSCARFIAAVRRDSREADGFLREMYVRICRTKEMRRIPRLLISGCVNSPCAFGWFSPCIVMPEKELTGEVLAGTLLHEITHCRRGDLFAKVGILFVRAVHWFNPLVHYAADKCAAEMELSCDEAVLRGCSDATRADYGEVMLEIVRRCRKSHGSMTTHFNPRKNAVRRRFLNILYGSGSRRGIPLIVLCLIACVLAGTIVACRVTESSEDTSVPVLPDHAAAEAMALTEQIADFVMTKEWLLDGYAFTETDADRLVYSLVAVRENEAHPCASQMQLSDNGRFITIPMAAAEALPCTVFGYEGWSYHPATEYEPIQRNEERQTYRFALEVGLWNSPFSLMDISAETEGNSITVRGILMHSDRFESAETETVYGECTFEWIWTEDGASLTRMYLRDTSVYGIDLIWHDGAEKIVPAAYYEMTPDQITGLTTDIFPGSAPITVGGNTVFSVKTKTGYAAGWVAGEYDDGKIPFEKARWFRVATDPPQGEGIPVLGASILSCPGVFDGHAFLMGYHRTTYGTGLYFFDEAGVLYSAQIAAGNAPLETDIDGDGEKELITMQDGDGHIWDAYEGGIRFVDGNELNRQLTEALGGSAMWNPYEGSIRVSVYKQYIGTKEYAVQIRGDRLAILPLSAEKWTEALKYGENAQVLLSVPAGTEETAHSFRITVSGQTAEIILGGAAFLAGVDAPLVRCADYTGDGIDDALVIFHMMGGAGDRMDEAVLVSGADGSASSAQNAYNALNDRLAKENGSYVLKTDDGESVPLSVYDLNGDSVRIKQILFSFGESGTLQGKAVLGYGSLNVAEDPAFWLEYSVGSRGIRIKGVTRHEQYVIWRDVLTDASGKCVLRVPADAKAESRTFCVSIEGRETTFSLWPSALLMMEHLPQMYCGDYTGDGAEDALIIFTTGAGTGVHLEEAVLVNGESGKAAFAQNPGVHLKGRLRAGEDGGYLLSTDDGRTAFLSEDVFFDQFFRYSVKNGVLRAEVPVGYGLLQYREDLCFTVEYTMANNGIHIRTVMQLLDEVDGGALAVDVQRVPIIAYGSGEELGFADVTLTYNELICDTERVDLSESAGLRNIAVIRADALWRDGAINPENEVFNWFYSGYARVYDLTRTTVLSPADKYRFPTTQFHHGMTEEQKAVYGADADAEFRARREYMYILMIDANTWLCLDYLLAADVPEIPREADHYDKILQRIEVPKIVYDETKFAPYILDAFIAKLQKESGVSVQYENSVVRLDKVRIELLLDAMRYTQWTPFTDGTEVRMIPSGCTIALSGNLCLSATERDNVLALECSGREQSIVCTYTVPDGVTDSIVRLVQAEKDRQQAAYDARIASIQAYLPAGAAEQLVMHKIFMSNDYLLAYRGESKEPILWRADDTGENYVIPGDVKYTQIHLDIPKEFSYDRAEVVGITGDGGSGGYILYVALYTGNEVQYICFSGWFREQPVYDADELSYFSPDHLMSIAGENVVFPNRNMPRAIDDLSEWNFTDLSGGEDIRSFLAAFLIGDTETVEQMCGVPSGMYASLKSLQFRDWVIYQIDVNGKSELRISFRLSYSESEIFPIAAEYGVYTLSVQQGVNGIILSNTDGAYSEAWMDRYESVVLIKGILAAVGTPIFPTTDEMDSLTRWQITGMLCFRLGRFPHPVADVAKLAEEIFGIKNFTPDEKHVQEGNRQKTSDMPAGDYCTTLAHDMTTSLHYVVIGMQEVGRQTFVKVQFFADPSRLVKTELVQYTLSKNENDGYRVVESTVVEKSP